MQIKHVNIPHYHYIYDNTTYHILLQTVYFVKIFRGHWYIVVVTPERISETAQQGMNVSTDFSYSRSAYFWKLQLSFHNVILQYQSPPQNNIDLLKRHKYN